MMRRSFVREVRADGSRKGVASAALASGPKWTCPALVDGPVLAVIASKAGHHGVSSGGVMIQEHDCVVLTRDLPSEGLVAGDVGTVVHVHKGVNPCPRPAVEWRVTSPRRTPDVPWWSVSSGARVRGRAKTPAHRGVP